MHETQQNGITLADLLEELEPDLDHLSDANHQMLWDIVTLWRGKQWLLMRQKINTIFKNKVLNTSGHNKRLAVLREALNRLKDEATKNLPKSSS
ncbi:hypothetical protein H6769_02020 [Candidatus Peribacteria bacterium]|nr:hypothetical protein [Candidatus Peribacteria bacterium]